ncbi:hypothetical protein NIES4071_71650 [Calothrix sp. NIES-4071]|nr:hypothetical protein NIES4071_71650 [Calothrix sp. NIES-4071]BAZ61440.1 hypothetical protein NIES4105_71600 [Calothrix sp. NIES-4105]
MINCDLSKAFLEGQVLTSRSDLMYLKPYEVGKLVLTSGKLVACDPLVFAGTEPFEANLAPGSYPVILSLAYKQDEKFPLVAFAKVCLSDKNPVRWKLATKAGEDLACLKDNEVFGYGVDSGIGCFMDADASQILVDNTWKYCEVYEETLACKLDQLLDEENDLGIMLTNMCVNEATGANIIAFSVGIGDGFYSSYFGYGVDNSIVEVVTTCISI